MRSHSELQGVVGETPTICLAAEPGVEMRGGITAPSQLASARSCETSRTPRREADGNPLAGGLDRVSGKMSVAGGCLDLVVAEVPGDHRQAFP